MNAFDFFSVLGKDQVRLRVIGDSGAKKLNWHEGYEQPENHDVFFVVNDGGDAADDITLCRAFFVEWDDKPIEWQLTAWQELGLPEPTLQLLTGNKSVHNYWVLDKPCTVQNWRNIQQRLIEYSGSDPALKDPSRVMRVPGFLHRKTGSRAEVVHSSDSRVTLRGLDGLLPQVAKKMITRRIKNLEPGTQSEIDTAFAVIPPRAGSGTNTYTKYRNIAWGLARACEAAGLSADYAIGLIEDAGWADFDARHVIEYNGSHDVTAGSFWYWAYQHGFQRSLRVPKQIEVLSGKPWIERLGWVAPDQGKLHKPTPGQLVTSLRGVEGAFKWNEMDDHVWIDGAPIEDIDMSHLYIEIERCGLKVAKDTMTDCVCKLAREHKFHPVRDYLDSCDVPLPDEMWANVCQVLLGGEPTEFDNSMLRKWLIGGVARAYDPGAAFGHVHVLSGEGMSGKSRFFQELASDDWFLEGFSPSNNPRDDALKMHRKWIVEWGELDASIGGRTAGATKNLLSVKTDSMRVPYGRGVQDYGRPFILCGTTNKSDGFFVDETGNRRFVVYEVTENVDFKKIQSMRDSVWASAKRDYLNGQSWWPSQEEKVVSEKANALLMEDDPWTDEIDKNWVRWMVEPDPERGETMGYLTTSGVLKGLQIPANQQDHRALPRIARILRRLGFKKTRKEVNHRTLVIYRPPMM